MYKKYQQFISGSSLKHGAVFRLKPRNCWDPLAVPKPLILCLYFVLVLATSLGFRKAESLWNWIRLPTTYHQTKHRLKTFIG